MAGIITDVKNDIQRLKDLKSAIDDVKKSIASIDIKVDINITKGLEAKLKSLTDQYDKLATKIIKTEAEIALSAKNVITASDKIIQAQNALSKASEATQKPSNNQSRGLVEIANIQAQSKAYEALKGEIDKVIGSREWNIRRMMEESNSIRLINAEIKEINKYQNNSVVLSSAQQSRLTQLNDSLITHKAALAEVRKNLNNNAKIENAAATSMNGLSQSLSRMRIAYRELTEEERNSKFGKELLDSIQQADAQIKKLDTVIGNHQRSVGDYKMQWDGLGMSIQQLGRELPSLAYGPKIFFSAISNNLSILADEIKRARIEYALLKKAGQQATPVWKQITSSLFSWQSALTVGITLLTLYGDKIIDWAGSLFSAKKTLSETFQSLEDFQKKVGDTSGLVIVTLERLSKGWKQLGGNIDAQKKYILDNKDAINSMGVSITNAAEAERLFNTNKNAFILGILQRAKAAATMELAAEEYKKAVQKMMEVDLMPDKSSQFIQTSSFGTGYWVETENLKKKKAKKEADDLFKSGSELVQKYTQFSEEERKILESIGVKTTETLIQGSVEAIEAIIAIKQQSLKKATDPKEYARIEAEIKAEQIKLDAIVGGKPDKEDEQKKQLEKQKAISKELLSLRLQNQQAEINLMAEGREKRLAQIEFDYDSEIAVILAKEKEWKEAQGGKLTKEQTVEIQTSFLNSYVKKEKSTALIDKEQMEAEKKAMNEYLKEYGNYQEKRKAITDKYNGLIAKATTEGERLSLGEEMKKELATVDDEVSKKTSIITKLFSDMSNRTVTDIRAIADEAQRMLDYVNSGEFKADDKGNGLFGMTKEQFDILAKSPEQLQAIKDEIANVRKEADQMDTSFNKISGGLKKIFSAGDDNKKLKEGLVEIEEGMNDVMQAGQFLADSFSAIGDAFGSDLMSGVADGLNVAMDAMSSAMDGAKAGAMFGPIGAAAGAAIGVVTSLATSISKIHDAKNEKRIERLQDQIETLDKSYEALDKAINKAYSNDASNLIDQQNKLLEQQKVIIQQQIREEEDKKKTDNDRIKEWREQIDEINNVISDNKEAGKDAIFGEDIKSAIDNFAQAYTDAWAAGEDKSKSAKDVVKNMIKSMIQESIKAAASDPMKEIREKLLEFWSDGYISDWEQDYLDKKAQDLVDQLDRKFGWADKYMKDEVKPDEEEVSDNTLKGAYAKASQESIDLLAGQTGATRVIMEDIRNNMIPIREQMQFIYDLQKEGWQEVKAIRELSDKIEKNTEQIAENTSEIKAVSDKVEQNTRSTVDALEGTINVKVKM